ncbi:Polyadenylate-binding protein RBP47B'-like protein [Drosera capensis]
MATQPQPQPHPGPHHQAASTAPYHQPQTLEEVRTLWIGDLQYWVDEQYLHSWFAPTGEVKQRFSSSSFSFDDDGDDNVCVLCVWDEKSCGVGFLGGRVEVVSIKIIRNKITGQPEGYGFIEFSSHAAAERVLQTYNGTLMPGTEQLFRLNWASFGIGEKRPDAGPEHSIFVGDLAPDVTDYLLQETFRVHFPSVRGAKVVTDPNTGRSKGYGFVKFADEMERNRAMTEMNGMYCSSRPMRISAATPKKTTGVQQHVAVKAAIYPAPAYVVPSVPVPALPAAVPADNDLTNTTLTLDFWQLFVGNLDPNISEEELRQYCLQFGEIVYAKIPASKGCGFVQFASRSSAEEAMQRLQGTLIGQQVIRVSWGKNAAPKQDVPGSWSQQVDPSQWSNAYYGYGAGYDAYGYAAAQDPSLYAYGTYAGYGQYPEQARLSGAHLAELDELMFCSFSMADGMQDVAAAAGVVPGMEPKEDVFDPLAPLDVDRLNAAYFAVHGRAILGRAGWLATSSFPRQASSSAATN